MATAHKRIATNFWTKPLSGLFNKLTLPFSERRFLLFVVDLFLVNASMLAAFVLWRWYSGAVFSWDPVLQYWHWFPVCSATWALLGWILDLYDMRLASRRLVVLRQLGIAVVVSGAGYFVLYFLSPVSRLPRVVFIFFFALEACALSIWRALYVAVFTMPQTQSRVLIVGAGWAGRTCAELLQEHGQGLYQVIGFVDDDPAKTDAVCADLPIMCTSAGLADLVRENDIDKVIVAITNDIRSELFQALVACRAMGRTVVRMPELYAALIRQIPVEHVDMGWVLDALDDFNASSTIDDVARRFSDIFGAVLGLVVLGVLLPFVALAVALDDRGPLFYTQVRSGKAGKPFDVIKFRTMRTDAEKDGQARWATEHDGRITRVGRFLRKTRLDELPQVINILRGDMHIVGPRPERPVFIEQLEQQIPFYRTRLVVKPGLTGWAQIHYEYGNSVDDARIKLQYDLYYIRHRSIWMDIYVVIKTFGVILRMGGL